MHIKVKPEIFLSSLLYLLHFLVKEWIVLQMMKIVRTCNNARYFKLFNA